ncbi:MAG TPA: hypothetical protein VK421_12960 [Pyrinomonadaceae bacterium]|nr:hypothetical protein [Pyrinomonadaceae bacterium]
MSAHADHLINKRATSVCRAFILVSLIPFFANVTRARQAAACAGFQKAVKATYNFKPSQLKSEAESNAKSAAMDRVWEMVKARPAELLPCLRDALADPQADPWFRFDGSNLLVSLDPSAASKAEQVRQYTAVDLDDVNLMIWVSTLAQRGAEGFDVSEAGGRWLAYPKAKYYLPQHGAREVDKFLGGIFIFGSMDEAQATPALFKIAASASHPGRDIAISLLLMQATPEAVRGLKALDLTGLPSSMQAALRAHLNQPKVIAPRDKPKTTRAQFVKAFEAAAKGDWKYFSELVSEVPDGERDVAAVLKPEDIPLLRKVRRARIAHANHHAAEYYVSFTQILMTMISRTETVK